VSIHTHNFDEPGPIYKGNPTIKCVNEGCLVLWHADRNKPTNTCKGGEPKYKYDYTVAILETKVGDFQKEENWKVRNIFVHHHLGAAVESLQSAVLHASDLMIQEGAGMTTLLPNKDGTMFLLTSYKDRNHQMVVTVVEQENE